MKMTPEEITRAFLAHVDRPMLRSEWMTMLTGSPWTKPEFLAVLRKGAKPPAEAWVQPVRLRSSMISEFMGGPPILRGRGRLLRAHAACPRYLSQGWSRRPAGSMDSINGSWWIRDGASDEDFRQGYTLLDDLDGLV